MINKPEGLGYRRLAAAVAVILAAPGLTAAQETQVDEEIFVTGSFISRPADRPAPVSVLDAEEIRANQRVTLAEVVRDMPQITSANTTANWENATNGINLRGLGDRSTLILLNGQRMTIDANAGSQVDINNLAPTIMVERLELLLDGASALYGSDAVAGVANFITRDNFEGLEMNVSSQWADTQSDVPEFVIGTLFGTGDNNTHLVLGVEMQRREDKLQEEDRFGPERLHYGLQTALWNPGSYLGAGGWFADPLCGSTEIGGTGVNDRANPAGYKNAGGPDFCRGNLSLQRTNTPEMNNLLGMAVLTQDFDAGGLESFRLEAGFARADSRSSFGTGVPLLALPSVSGTSSVLPSANPGVYDAWFRSGGAGTPIGGVLDTDYTNGTFPYQDFSRIFSRQLSPLDGDAASLDSESVQNTYRIAASLEGVFGDSSWDWRVNGTFSQNDQKNNPNDTITDRYLRAVNGYGGPSCKWNFVEGVGTDPGVEAGAGPCQYWNPFASRFLAPDPTDNSPINPADPNSPTVGQLHNSPELLDWMMFGGQNLNESRFTSVEAIVTGDLWEMAGGSTGLAIGAQYRKQELEIGVDPIQKDGGLGFSPQILRDWRSDRETDAVFAELVMYPHETFEVDIAARWEETLGVSSTEPKISMLWTPTDSVFVRATAGSSFRLGSENQLFGIGPGSVGRDTLGGQVTQAVGIAVGNTALVPEESDNWTIGITWDITDNFTFDLTYWDYEFTNLVATTDAEDTLRADLLDGYVNGSGPGDWNDPAFVAANAASPHPLFFGRPNEFCDPMGADFVAGGTERWDGVGNLPAGCLTGFDFEIFRSSWINQNAVVTNGFDLTLDWRKDFSGGGVFGARFIGAFTEEYSGIDNLSGQLRDVAGTTGDGVAGIQTNPDLRANTIFTYLRGNHNFRATHRFTAGSLNLDPNILEAPFDEGDYYQWDFVYNYDLPLRNPATLSFTVLNVTDEEPPLDPNGLVTYNQALYDGRGRMYRIMWNQGF